jgi:hypothetical protein
VVKARQHGRLIHVTTRVVDGTLAQGEAALQASPARRTINPSGVERHHLTVRQHARRLGRQVNAFATEPDDREPQRPRACASAPVVGPPHRLRHRLPQTLPTTGQHGARKQGKPAPPAMAAGLTNHGWTMDAWRSCRVPPKPVWC